MKLGYFVANQNPAGESAADRIKENLEQVRVAKDAGFDLICAGQHYLSDPYQMPATFPFLARLAAESGDMQLAATVIRAPLHNPVDLAESIATLDAITDGRFIFGVGLGYCEEEFRAFGIKRAERVPRLLESLEIIKRLWTEDQVEHQGRFYQVPLVTPSFRPTQVPHPPIWIGGESRPAIRRAATLGDGWFPIGTNPANPLETLPELARGIDLLRRYAEQAGRDPASVDVAYAMGWPVGDGPDGGGRLLTGPMSKIESDLAELEALGVRHLSVGLTGGTVRESIERMEAFAEEIFPLASPEHGG